MIARYYVRTPDAPAPASERTVFADGSADESFRPGVDLELSHWVPNRTPERWKADTSTEICLRFLEDPPEEAYDLAVNNHVDVDGILSLWCLTHRDAALRQWDTLVGAAEMGDFSACAPYPAQRLFLGLTLVMLRGKAESWPAPQTYEEAFRQIPGLLSGRDELDPRVDEGLDALEFGIEQIEAGVVMVAEATSRLTLFSYPLLEDEDLAHALHVPAFNAFPDDSVWLWPQARNRFDGECVQLVSVPSGQGFYHDLWYPGYMWAETPKRWRAPGFVHDQVTNGYRLELPELASATARLQAKETAEGTWTLATKLSPFASIPGRGFPVVLSFLGADGQPALSQLDSSAVAKELVGVFP